MLSTKIHLAGNKKDKRDLKRRAKEIRRKVATKKAAIRSLRERIDELERANSLEVGARQAPNPVGETGALGRHQAGRAGQAGGSMPARETSSTTRLCSSRAR